MRPKFTKTLATTAVAITLVAGMMGSAAADVASFYKNKTITMYISFSAGGGYDAYARLIMRHMTRHIPGNPKSVSKQYTGAGGLRTLNALYNVFPQDGTVIGQIGRSAIAQPLWGAKGAKFDGSKLKWLGSANTEYSLCVFWHESKFKSTEDLLTKRPNMGGVGIGSSIDVFTLLANNLLGAKIKLITGYPGGADINLAHAERRAVRWSHFVGQFGSVVKVYSVV